jgi:hypothetical protein
VFQVETEKYSFVLLAGEKKELDRRICEKLKQNFNLYA